MEFSSISQKMSPYMVLNFSKSSMNDPYILSVYKGGPYKIILCVLCYCRKDKYRSVRSKTLWETKHYHQQNQENLTFRGQLMLSRILFHFTGECAYEILILDLVIFIIFYEKTTPFLCRSKEIQVLGIVSKCDLFLNKFL